MYSEKIHGIIKKSFLKNNKLKLIKNIWLLCLIVLVSSCDQLNFDFLQFSKTPKGKTVARVYDKYLYDEDLKLIVNLDLNPEDSILQVDNYINNWVKKQLLLAKADINLSDKKNKFDYLVEKYREDLYINSYKDAVIQQYLDREINPTDIDVYYEQNQNNFKLNEELLMLKFIKLNKDLGKEKKEHLLLEKLIKSNNKEDADQLSEKVLSFENHHLNDSVWIKYSDLIRKIPFFETIEKQKLIKNQSFIKLEDSLSRYLIYVKKALKRNEVAPKKYITPTIEQMILHQRKLKLINDMEQQIYEDAKRDEQFEIYDNDEV